MNNTILDENINILNLSNNIYYILEIHNINTINQLCNKTKTDLKNIGLFRNQISSIEVALQLAGQDLKNNRY